MKDYITIFALFAGPAIAVIITLWHQSRTAKREAKQKLFLDLMSHRKTMPPTREWVNALNLIYVVYADNQSIVQYWQALYEIINTQPWNSQRYTHAHLDLLSAMARELGYKGLTQTDIDKFYSPDALAIAASMQAETQIEFLRVLKSSENFGTARATKPPGTTLNSLPDDWDKRD
jgi:hypothetical protein